MAGRVWIGALAVLAVTATILFAVYGGAAEREHGLELTYRLDTDGDLDAALDKAVAVERRRIDHLHIQSPKVYQREDQLRVEVVAATRDELEQLRATVERTGTLTLQAVDTEQPLLRLWVEHVRELHPPGIAAKETPLHTAAGPEIVDRYLVANTKDALARYLGRLGIDEPLFAVPVQRELRYGKIGEELTDGPGVTTERWRTYLLEGEPWITAASIAKATPLESQNMPGRWEVQLELDAAGGARFGDLSAAAVGHKVAIVLDGEVVSDPIIESAIRGGRISISLGGSVSAERQHEDAVKLADTLGAGALPGKLTLLTSHEVEIQLEGIRWNVLAVLGLAVTAAAIAAMGLRWRR